MLIVVVTCQFFRVAPVVDFSFVLDSSHSVSGALIIVDLADQSVVAYVQLTQLYCLATYDFKLCEFK